MCLKRTIKFVMKVLVKRERNQQSIFCKFLINSLILSPKDSRSSDPMSQKPKFAKKNNQNAQLDY